MLIIIQLILKTLVMVSVTAAGTTINQARVPFHTLFQELCLCYLGHRKPLYTRDLISPISTERDAVVPRG